VAIERFGQYDTDKNGAIDIHELKQADRSMPANVRESAFQRIDANRDGKITIEEFDKDAGMAIQEKFRREVAN
jgi:Ca2+-binding EF-hand superfamily protein